jgi:hypothetical protein
MFPIRAIHQIEMTSRCNLRCRYCAHPTMARSKADMDDATYAKALLWARQLPSHELNLAGIGESTMHPEFVRNVHFAREAVGPNLPLVLATNGLLMTLELARAIAPARPRIWVSLHRPEKAGPAIEVLKQVQNEVGYQMLFGVSADASIDAVDWAGQVKWHVSTKQKGEPCQWVKPGRVFILSDGRVARCCFDAKADDVIGTVDDDLTQLQTAPYKLCAACHHDVGVPLPPAKLRDIPLKLEAQVAYRHVAGGTSVP